MSQFQKIALTVEEWGWVDYATTHRRGYYGDASGVRDLDLDATLGAAGEMALAKWIQNRTGWRSKSAWIQSLSRDEGADGLPDLFQFHIRTSRHYGDHLLVRPTSTRDGKWDDDEVVVMCRLDGKYNMITRPAIALIGWVSVGRFMKEAGEFDDNGATAQGKALGLHHEKLDPIETLPLCKDQAESWVYGVYGMSGLKVYMEESYERNEGAPGGVGDNPVQT